jgi:hypothetical protein
MSPGPAISRLRRLLALPRARQALLLDGAWALLTATWCVRTWPFSRLASTLGTAASPTAATPPSLAPADSTYFVARADEVRWAIGAWARAWPRPPTCLMQAVAARQLLVARGIPCELYFGVRSQSAGPESPDHNIGAHAWLRCADTIVTGDSEAAMFNPIAVYRFSPPAATPQP